MKTMTSLGLLALGAVAMLVAFAFGAGTAGAGDAHKFVGVETCGTSSCHGGDKAGNQLKKWYDDPHAASFDALAEDKGAGIAKKLGIAKAEESEKCTGCHVTGGNAAATMKGEKFDPEDGVGCESCHGAGGTFKDDKHQKDKKWAVANGMTDLADKAVRKTTCDACHGKIDAGMVKAGHPKASKYEEREAKYKEFAHWNTKPSKK